MEHQVIWLLGREGGIGLLPVDGHLHIFLGDQDATILPGYLFKLNNRSVKSLHSLIGQYLTTGRIALSSPDLDTLWGDDPQPTL